MVKLRLLHLKNHPELARHNAAKQDSSLPTPFFHLLQSGEKNITVHPSYDPEHYCMRCLVVGVSMGAVLLHINEYLQG